MNLINEFPFRLAFGILWAAYFVVRLYFQRKVNVAGSYEHVNEKQEKFYFRLFALGYLLQLFYIFTSWVDFAHLPFPDWLRWMGGGLTLAGIGLFGWAHQALGNNWTAILALSSGHELVTSGPYRLVRHPMYTGFFTIGLGSFFISANWLMATVYLVPLVLMYRARVGAEETMMLGRFGENYRAYMQKTGRLLPHW